MSYQGRRRAANRATREAARLAESELLRELKADHTAGQAPTAPQPATLRQVLEIYVDGLADRGKSADTISVAVGACHSIERLTPALLDKPVSQITEADIFAFRRARVEQSATAVRLRAEAAAFRGKGERGKAKHRDQAAKIADKAGTKPSTINRDLRTLRAALKRAIPGYRFPAGAFFPEDETRVRWLRPEDELLVLEPMRSPFREIAQLAALTLMRLSEIRTLRREDVFLAQGVIMLPRAKEGARPVVLSDRAQEILRAQLAGHNSSWVFPNAEGQPWARDYVGRVFRRAARAARLKDFTLHDLRHHGSTMALNAGFTTPVLMALGGWKTEKMLRRYAAVTDPTLRAAANAVAGEPTATPWPRDSPRKSWRARPA